MTWQEAAGLATMVTFMLGMGAIGWRAAILLGSIDRRLDRAMVLIERHDDMIESARSSRRGLREDVNEIKTWVQVHEEKHA
tara:strand:- start:4047 stop:4289 length:243 start_codon:yes stop_codon:yes gene_type:complete